MSTYDSKQVKCSLCGKAIGEISRDSSIIFPLCGPCKKKEKQTIRNEIKKILVPVEVTKKSAKALDAAIYLAKNLGSTITVMQVVSTVAISNASLFTNVYKELSNDAKESVRWAKEYCEKKNVSAKHRIVQGDEAEKILKTAKKSNYDLIVIGSSGKGAFKELFFGSVSNYVMQNSSIPVLTVKETSKLNTKTKRAKRGSKTPKELRRGDGVSFSKMKRRAGLK